MYGLPGYAGSTASPSNPPSAEAFTPSTVPTSVTRPPTIRLIVAVSRSATNALLSGKNAKPHGTWIPVATVPPTVSFNVPTRTELAVDGAAELAGAEPPGAFPEQPATSASAATTVK